MRGERIVLEEIDRYCEESLHPEMFEKWRDVMRELEASRPHMEPLKNGWHKVSKKKAFSSCLIPALILFENNIPKYGFNFTGNWTGLVAGTSYNNKHHSLEPATEHEVLTNLSNLAKKKGVRAGADVYWHQTDKTITLTEGEFSLLDDGDKLIFSGVLVMEKGEWPEIFKPENPEGDISTKEALVVDLASQLGIAIRLIK